MFNSINLDFYSVLLLIGSLILSVQMVPQIYRIYVLKSARDFSYGTIFIVLFGVSTIVVYGFHFNAFELWFPPLIQIVCMSTVLIMKLYYGRHRIDLNVNVIHNEPVDINIISHTAIGIRTIGDSLDYMDTSN